MPGPDCTACTRPEYFRCTSANKCLHPKLECDGHPHCPEAEDEDPEKCYKNQFRNKIEKIYTCKSILYEKMTVYATRCDFVKECANGEDEKECYVKIEQNIILGVICLIVMFLYLALTLAGLRKDSKSLDNQETEENNRKLQDLKDILEVHLNNENEMIKANILLLNSIHTRTVMEKRQYLSIFTT